MPSRSSLQACRNTVSPPPAMCSLNRMPGRALANDGCERGLAHFQRIAPHVGAVQLDQVESVEEYTIVVAIPAPASARAASRLGRRGLCRGLARRTYCDADLDRAGRP